jgi:hypothetical protein
MNSDTNNNATTNTNNISDDTIKLLRECDAGIKMGIEAIDEVLNNVAEYKLKEILKNSKDVHEQLQDKATELLHEYNDEGKNPNPMAKGMSWLKTNVKLAVNDSDETVADLMTDGCDMGVKSLSKYLNKYKAADEDSKDIAKRLINIEERLAVDIRAYL